MTWKNKIVASCSLWQEMKIKGRLCHDGEIHVCYYSHLENTGRQERLFVFKAPVKSDSSDPFVTEAS